MHLDFIVKAQVNKTIKSNISNNCHKYKISITKGHFYGVANVVYDSYSALIYMDMFDLQVSTPRLFKICMSYGEFYFDFSSYGLDELKGLYFIGDHLETHDILTNLGVDFTSELPHLPIEKIPEFVEILERKGFDKLDKLVLYFNFDKGMYKGTIYNNTQNGFLHSYFDAIGSKYLLATTYEIEGLKKIINLKHEKGTRDKLYQFYVTTLVDAFSYHTRLSDFMRALPSLPEKLETFKSYHKKYIDSISITGFSYNSASDEILINFVQRKENAQLKVVVLRIIATTLRNSHNFSNILINTNLSPIYSDSGLLISKEEFLKDTLLMFKEIIFGESEEMKLVGFDNYIEHELTKPIFNEVVLDVKDKRFFTIDRINSVGESLYELELVPLDGGKIRTVIRNLKDVLNEYVFMETHNGAIHIKNSEIVERLYKTGNFFNGDLPSYFEADSKTVRFIEEFVNQSSEFISRFIEKLCLDVYIGKFNYVNKIEKPLEVINPMTGYDADDVSYFKVTFKIGGKVQEEVKPLTKTHKISKVTSGEYADIKREVTIGSDKILSREEFSEQQEMNHGVVRDKDLLLSLIAVAIDLGDKNWREELIKELNELKE